MILHLKLNEDHLKLIRMLYINDEDDDVLTINRHVMLSEQSHLLDDVASVLGMKDKVIKGTEEDADGGAYDDETEKYLLDTYHYVSDNLFLIETLLHQRCVEGVQAGKYRCCDTDMIWSKED